MKAYIVQYRPRPDAWYNVSQEAYWTLEDAQRFIENRAGCPIKSSDYLYLTALTEEEYRITEVTLPKREEVSISPDKQANNKQTTKQKRSKL